MFADEIVKVAKTAILFDGKATEKLRALLPKNFPVESRGEYARGLCACARTAAKIGDIVLLSPGATSFGIFKNEYDRGDQFKKCVNALKK